MPTARRAKPTDAFAAAYYCLQVSTTYLLGFIELWEIYAIFPILGWLSNVAYLRDLQHKISKYLRWRTCCSDEFGAQLYWLDSSMKYSSHIGAVVVGNVRIHHDLGYILVICEYLQHKILEWLRRGAKPTDAFVAAYYCLQVSTTYLQGFIELWKNCAIFHILGWLSNIAYLRDLQHTISKCLRWRT